MGSHSVTCHPAEVTFPPLPLPKLVLDVVAALASLVLVPDCFQGRNFCPSPVLGHEDQSVTYYVLDDLKHYARVFSLCF